MADTRLQGVFDKEARALERARDLPSVRTATDVEYMSHPCNAP